MEWSENILINYESDSWRGAQKWRVQIDFWKFLPKQICKLIWNAKIIKKTTNRSDKIVPTHPPTSPQSMFAFTMFLETLVGKL